MSCSARAAVAVRTPALASTAPASRLLLFRMSANSSRYLMSVGGIAQNRARHAMPSAAAAAGPEPRAANRDHFHASLAQQRVRVDVAVVSDDDAGFQRDDIVAVVPLLALGLVDVAPRADGPELLQSQGILHDLQHRFRFCAHFEAAALIGRIHAVAADLVDNFAEDTEEIAIAEAEHGVEVHGCTALRQEAGDDARRGLVAEQHTCHLADRLMCGALAH